MKKLFKKLFSHQINVEVESATLSVLRAEVAELKTQNVKMKQLLCLIVEDDEDMIMSPSIYFQIYDCLNDF
jgi:cell shape-determining protein MreC